MVYNPEEIEEMADRLLKEIATASEGEIDIETTLNFVDKCAQLIKNLAESVSELHQRVDIITEKE